MDLLAIAFYSSILTYYLGVLVYMLPIPFYGVKKWAPQLMTDGVFSAILVFSYNTLLWSIEYFTALLGADWNSYNTWLIGETSSIISALLVLKAIGIGLSSIGLRFLATGFISPLISTLTYILIFLLTYTTLVSILRSIAPTMIALGILLHSIPFRLTRSSGAMIIAVTIVFTIGTPLMPSFIDMITSQYSINTPIGYGVSRAVICLKDGLNQPLSYTLFEAYSIDNGKLLARYLAGRDGVVNASTIETGIPSDVFRANISLAGYYYLIEIDPRDYPYIDDTDIVNITIKLPNTIQLKPLRIVNVPGIIEAYKSYNHVEATIDNINETEMIIITLTEDTVAVAIDGVEKSPDETYQYTWGGIGFEAYIYTIDSGEHLIEVDIYGDNEPKPSIDEVKYIHDTLGLGQDTLNRYIEIVVFYLYRLLVAPLVYVSILFSASTALSRILGGTSSRIARIVVTGV